MQVLSTKSACYTFSNLNSQNLKILKFLELDAPAHHSSSVVKSKPVHLNSIKEKSSSTRYIILFLHAVSHKFIWQEVKK